MKAENCSFCIHLMHWLDAWWNGLNLGGQVRCGSGSVESVSFEYEEAVVMAVVMAAVITTQW